MEEKVDGHEERLARIRELRGKNPSARKSLTDALKEDRPDSNVDGRTSQTERVDFQRDERNNQSIRELDRNVGRDVTGSSRDNGRANSDGESVWSNVGSPEQSHPTIRGEDRTRPQGLVAEPIPFKKRGPGRPKKNPTIEPEPTPKDKETITKMVGFGHKIGIGPVSTKVLNNSEADKIKAQMVTAIVLYCDGMDWFLSHSNNAHKEAIIWAIDEDDAEILAEAIISAGKKSAPVAVAIRSVGKLSGFVEIGKITLPRFFQTAQFYAQNGGFGW